MTWPEVASLLVTIIPVTLLWAYALRVAARPATASRRKPKPSNFDFSGTYTKIETETRSRTKPETPSAKKEAK